MENLQQSLLEHMADWLDLESTKFEMNMLGLKDGENLHIFMAREAFKTFAAETTEKDFNLCESCENLFDIETMSCDDDSNWFCPACWKELAPVMKAEYDEMVAKGEIEE